MELEINRDREQIAILENDFNVFKGVLKYHLQNIEEFTKEVINNEEKNLKGEFESSTKKCLEAKEMPFTLVKNKVKKEKNRSNKVNNKSSQNTQKNNSLAITNNHNSNDNPKSNNKSLNVNNKNNNHESSYNN
jgi:hypothetical protein